MEKTDIKTAAISCVSAGAVCVMTLSNKFPDYLSEIMAYGGLTILIAGSVYLVADWIVNSLGWSLYKNWRFSSLSPFKVLIPLDKAVQKAYDANRETPHRHLLEVLDGSVTNGEDIRFQHLACQMLEGKLFYGLFGLGTKIEPVNIKEMGTISNDCKNTVNIGGQPVYRNIKMDRKDLKDYIKSLKGA